MVLCIPIHEKDKIFIGEFTSKKLNISEGDILYFYINKQKNEITFSKRKISVLPELWFEVICNKQGNNFFLKNSEITKSLLHFFKLQGNGSSKIIFQANEVSKSLYKITYLSCV